MKLRAAALALSIALLPTLAAAADWSPEQWKHQDTLQFRTDCPNQGEHWSFVWLVVLDGDVWIRLGGRAGGRVECNSTKPLTTIKIFGKEFANVELVSTPDMAERVAAAMAEKYSTDLFVRYMDHPYTMKVVPKAP